MSLEDELRKLITDAASGIYQRSRPVSRDFPGNLTGTMNSDQLTRVVAAQSDAIYRLAREVDQLRSAGSAGQDKS
jgi:hypothetical protein